VRDFFGVPGVSPTDLDSGDQSAIFHALDHSFLRARFLRADRTGAYLSLRRKSKCESSRFLFTRGLWLIFLEGVVTRCFGWQLNFDYHVTMLIVLWALGWAMIALSALVCCRPPR
jgi:uncharacterized membrane protein